MEAVEACDCGRFLDLAARAAAESEETKLGKKLNGTQSLRLLEQWWQVARRTLVHIEAFSVLC